MTITEERPTVAVEPITHDNFPVGSRGIITDTGYGHGFGMGAEVRRSFGGESRDFLMTSLEPSEDVVLPWRRGVTTWVRPDQIARVATPEPEPTPDPEPPVNLGALGREGRAVLEVGTTLTILDDTGAERHGITVGTVVSLTRAITSSRAYVQAPGGTPVRVRFVDLALGGDLPPAPEFVTLPAGTRLSDVTDAQMAVLLANGVEHPVRATDYLGNVDIYDGDNGFLNGEVGNLRWRDSNRRTRNLRITGRDKRAVVLALGFNNNPDVTLPKVNGFYAVDDRVEVVTRAVRHTGTGKYLPNGSPGTVVSQRGAYYSVKWDEKADDVDGDTTEVHFSYIEHLDTVSPAARLRIAEKALKDFEEKVSMRIMVWGAKKSWCSEADSFLKRNGLPDRYSALPNTPGSIVRLTDDRMAVVTEPPAKTRADSRPGFSIIENGKVRAVGINAVVMDYVGVAHRAKAAA